MDFDYVSPSELAGFAIDGLGFVLRSALGLDLGRVEHAVRTELAIGQRLRAVLERVRQRIDAAIDHVEPHVYPEPA